MVTTEAKISEALVELGQGHARPDCEMAMLGAMILDPSTIGEVLAIVPSSSWPFDARNLAVFDAIVHLYDKRKVGTLDLVQLADRLRDVGVFDNIGGETYLAQLMEGCPSAVVGVHHARIVAEKYRRRQLADSAAETLYDLQTSTDPVEQIHDRAEARLFAIGIKAESARVESLGKLLKDEMDRLDGPEPKGGQRTHLTALDSMLGGGLQPGELVILAARPGMGKSAAATTIAMHAATGGPVGYGGEPKHVALISLEMSKASLAKRLLSAASGVSMATIKAGCHDENCYKAVHAAYVRLSKAGLYIDDTAGLSLMQLRARARRLHARTPLGLIVVDYLQLLTIGKRAETRQVEVSEISRGIKALAGEFGVPILALSQLNRANEQRVGQRPRMSDLRESGALEQDANVVLLLHREEYYHDSDAAWRAEHADLLSKAEVIVAKQRNGPTGTIALRFIHETMTFADWTSPIAPGGASWSA